MKANCLENMKSSNNADQNLLTDNLSIIHTIITRYFTKKCHSTNFAIISLAVIMQPIGIYREGLILLNGKQSL